MTATTEDLVLRLRQLLLEQTVGNNQQEPTVSIGSAATSPVMKMDGSHFLTGQPPSSGSSNGSDNNHSISQAIFNVLQGLRPPPNTSRTSSQV